MTAGAEGTLDAIRAELARVALVAREDPAAFGAVVDELQPFIDAAARCAAEDDDSARRELRSVAWLLAYRAGDQGVAAIALESLLRAWRAHGPAQGAALLEGVRELIVDGYAKGREDRARADLLYALGASLPVLTLAPRVFAVVAADPLDAEGAAALADRAGAVLLREEARAVVVHLHGLREPRLDVLAALWALASTARMVGCACVVTGAEAALREALAEEALPREPVTFAAPENEAFETALRSAGVWSGAVPAPLRWISRMVRRP
jgi:hypothetical protein